MCASVVRVYVSDHCAQELKNVFDIEGTYELSVDEETKLLQVLPCMTQVVRILIDCYRPSI